MTTRAPGDYFGLGTRSVAEAVLELELARARRAGYRVLWHWQPEGKPEGFTACTGTVDTWPGHVCRNSLHMTEHRLTTDHARVSCENCRKYLPEERVARAERERRGAAVVEELALLGVSASYGDRGTPLVSLHLEEAEGLLRKIDVLRALLARRGEGSP